MSTVVSTSHDHANKHVCSDDVIHYSILKTVCNVAKFSTIFLVRNSLIKCKYVLDGRLEIFSIHWTIFLKTIRFHRNYIRRMKIKRFLCFAFTSVSFTSWRIRHIFFHVFRGSKKWSRERERLLRESLLIKFFHNLNFDLSSAKI